MRELLTAVLLALTAAAASPAHAEGLQAGLWQVTTTPEIDGVVAPPQRNMKCLTPEEVGDLDRTFSPVARTINSPCERVEHNFTPQKLRWRLVCTGQVDMEVAGEFVFESPLRYTATIWSRTTVADRLMQSTRAAIEGQHVGECR